MSARKMLAVVILLSTALFLVSCATTSGTGESDKVKTSQSVASSGVDKAETTDKIRDISSIFYADIQDQADIHGTRPAIIALAMLICKLDDSQDYYSLVKLDAKELFSRVREAAVKKNVTLETLDKNYCLSQILAAEAIFVEISSNNVTTVKPQQGASYGNDWVPKFHLAIGDKDIVDN